MDMQLSMFKFPLLALFLLFVTISPVKAAYTITWGTVPSQVTVGSYGTYKFSVKPTAGETTLPSYTCMINPVFSSNQSYPALQGSGTVNGKTVATDYGSAGFSSLTHASVTLPATFSLSLKNSNEVKPNQTGKVNVKLTIICGTSTSSTKTIAIVGKCYGKTCGCGTLPACKVPTTPTSATTQKLIATQSPTPTITNSISYTLPSVFTNSARTTNIAALTPEQRQHIDHLVLAVTNSNEIEFQDTVSFTDADKIQHLDTYVHLTDRGTVTIDSENIPELNKPAKITMYGLSFTETPKILRNGVDAGNYISNVTYDAKTGILSFIVSGFSTYTAVSSNAIVNGQTSLVSPMVIIGIGGGVLAIVLVEVSFLLKKRGSTKNLQA